MRNEIVKELITLSNILKREYGNIDLDYDLYIQGLLHLLKGEKVSVLFIHSNGRMDKKILPRNSLSPIYEMYNYDPLNEAKIINEKSIIDTSFIKKTKQFKFQGFEEPFVYIEMQK